MTIKPGERISPQTEFKQGVPASNKLPVGSITIRTHRGDYPRYWRKIEEPNKWIPNAIFVWMQNGGTIPKGFIVHHMDENTLNDDMSNLALVSRSYHIGIHREQLQRNKPSVLPIKNVVCSLCKSTYQVKAQRKKALCPACRLLEKQIIGAG